MRFLFRALAGFPRFGIKTLNFCFHTFAFLALGAVAAVSCVFNPAGTAFIVLALLSILIVSILAGRRRLLGGEATLFRYHRWYAVSLFVLSVFYFRTYTGVAEKDCAVDKNHVEYFYSAPQCGNIFDGGEKKKCFNYSRDPYDVITAGDRLAVAYTGKGRGLLLFDPRASGREAFVTFSEKERGPIRILYDEDRKQIVGGMQGSPLIFFLDPDSLFIKKELRISSGQVSDSDLFAGDYYFLSERRFFHRVAGDGSRVVSVPIEGAGAKLYSLRINSATGKLYVSHWLGSDVFKYDADTLRLEKVKRIGFFGSEVEVNEADNTVLVGQPMSSRILVLDGDTLEPKRAIGAGYGIRDIQLDRKTGKIHCVNYFEGTYMRIDCATGKTERKFRVGKLPRAIFPDEKTGEVYGVSACGIFRIPPE